MLTLRITKKTFTFEDFSPLLNGPLKVVLDQSIPKKVKNSYQQLLKILQQISYHSQGQNRQASQAGKGLRRNKYVWNCRRHLK